VSPYNRPLRWILGRRFAEGEGRKGRKEKGRVGSEGGTEEGREGRKGEKKGVDGATDSVHKVSQRTL